MIRLAVRVQAAYAELALAELLELVPDGVEEVELGEDVVEYAVYGAPGELPELPDLKAAAGDALVEVSSRRVAPDWDERWKRFHRPVAIVSPAPERAPGVYVRPPWESGAGEDASLDIVIDPGQAFGTGGHASTRLCLELLLDLAASAPDRGPVLDVGTGSGVLAIAAAKLGYGPVVALDNDPRSVCAAARNAQINRADVEVRRSDIRHEPPVPSATVDGDQAPRRLSETIVTANLLRPLLLDLAIALPGAPAHLLAGGLLADEVEEVAEAFSARLGLRERARREQGGWAAVWLQ